MHEPLRGMLRTKRYAQTEMCRWVELHATIRSKEADAETKKRAKEIQGRLVHAMSQRMPMTTAAKEVWEQIGETKDHKVVRQLTILASYGSSLSEVAAAQQDLKERMAPRLKSDAHKQCLEQLSLLT